MKIFFIHCVFIVASYLNRPYAMTSGSITTTPLGINTFALRASFLNGLERIRSPSQSVSTVTRDSSAMMEMHICSLKCSIFFNFFYFYCLTV